MTRSIGNWLGLRARNVLILPAILLILVGMLNLMQPRLTWKLLPIPNDDLSGNPPFSRFPYEYISQPDFSKHTKPSSPAIIYLRSTPADSKLRSKLRNYWTNDMLHYYNIPVVFVIGSETDGIFNDEITLENQKHNDILCSNFTDAYSNLNIKMWAIFNWHQWHLPWKYEPRHVFWGNTDTYINKDNFVKYIKSLPSKELISGAVLGGQPPVRETHKNQVSIDIYPYKTYPPYVSGSGVFASNDAFLKLASVCASATPRMMKEFKVDDALMTGVWREAVGLPLTDCAGKCKPWTALDKFTCETWSKAVFGHEGDVDLYPKLQQCPITNDTSFDNIVHRIVKIN